MKRDRFKEELVSRLVAWFRSRHGHHMFQEYLEGHGVDFVAAFLEEGVRPSEIGLAFAPMALKAINEEMVKVDFSTVLLCGGRVTELTKGQLANLGRCVMNTSWWKQNSPAVKRRHKRLATVRGVMET